MGQNLAGIIISTGQLPLVLLLQGELGAGKTTLVRGLIQGLPGRDQARVSSPSFNIVNIYPTNPEVLHLDLYRLSGTEAGDSLWEHLAERKARIIVVEWSEHLPAREYPEQYTLLSLSRQEQGRTAHIQVFGPGLQGLLQKMQPLAWNL